MKVIADQYYQWNIGSQPPQDSFKYVRITLDPVFSRYHNENTAQSSINVFGSTIAIHTVCVNGSTYSHHVSVPQ